MEDWKYPGTISFGFGLLLINQMATKIVLSNFKIFKLFHLTLKYLNIVIRYFYVYTYKVEYLLNKDKHIYI